MDPPHLAGIDTTGWSHVGGTSSGAYFKAAPGVVVAVPNEGFRQTERAARASLDEFNRIVTEAGHKHAVIILVDRVASQDAASRRVWSEDVNPLRCALALICKRPLARAIGSFFIGLNRPPVPTKMFAEYQRGLQWCQRMVEEQGGPI